MADEEDEVDFDVDVPDEVDGSEEPKPDTDASFEQSLIENPVVRFNMTGRL